MQIKSPFAAEIGNVIGGQQQSTSPGGANGPPQPPPPPLSRPKPLSTSHSPFRAHFRPPGVVEGSGGAIVDHPINDSPVRSPSSFLGYPGNGGASSPVVDYSNFVANAAAMAASASIAAGAIDGVTSPLRSAVQSTIGSDSFY